MLKLENKRLMLFIFILQFIGCTENIVEKDKTYLFFVKSNEIVGSNEYNNIYKQACDSLLIWEKNEIGNFKYHGKGKDFILDSLMCFNSLGDKFVGALININTDNPSSDGLDYFYGVKIDNKWFFLRGGYTVIPREMIKNHPINKPLSYQQLHKMALKNVYSGYLNLDRSINENWFKDHFEGPGWGDFSDQESIDWYLKGKRFKVKKEFFNFLYLESVKGNWLKRDTTQPILGLNGDTLHLF